MKDPQESFAHYQAKTILISWLREKAVLLEEGVWAVFCDEIAWRSNRSKPWYGVFDEYPLTGDDSFI